ncbi:hypothetical protein [Pseudomonas fluorescens]|uniref:hypothetical protein n=1 Tax=Pseudomonas fluorescens TaxID=294 RepID=UPI00124280CE|nr:hypothetical protein [Pseudomonas fluorescens]VVN09845.1 hypothetical protein PS639_03729 [Pseudomonas fluorescens]
MGDTSIRSKLVEAAPHLLKFLIKTRGGRIIIILVAFSVSCALGAKYGLDTSPKYLSKTAAIVFLVNNANYYQNNNKRYIFTLRAGLYEYKYSLTTDTVTKDIASPGELIGKNLPDRWSEEDFKNAISLLETLSPPAAATAAVETALSKTFKNISSKLEAMSPIAERVTGAQRVVFYVVAAIIGGTGGYIGYKLTYDPDDHLSDDAMIKTLMDPDSWRSFAREILVCELSAAIQESKKFRHDNKSQALTVQKSIKLDNNQSTSEGIIDCQTKLAAIRERNNKTTKK